MTAINLEESVKLFDEWIKSLWKIIDMLDQEWERYLEWDVMDLQEELKELKSKYKIDNNILEEENDEDIFE